MTADYLLIDVGNGRTKLGLSTRDALMDRRDLPTHGVTPELIREAVAGWDFRRAVIASVVPAVVPVWRAVFPDLLELRHDTAMGIGVRYPRPESIGPDRLANAVALAHLHGAPGIVIETGWLSLVAKFNNKICEPFWKTISPSPAAPGPMEGVLQSNSVNWVTATRSPVSVSYFQIFKRCVGPASDR